MDADSVSHMMHCNHLISDDDYEAITAAPNDSMMNAVILQYVRAMDLPMLLKFADLLKDMETRTQKSISAHLKFCTYVATYIVHVCSLYFKIFVICRLSYVRMYVAMHVLVLPVHKPVPYTAVVLKVNMMLLHT